MTLDMHSMIFQTSPIKTKADYAHLSASELWAELAVLGNAQEAACEACDDEAYFAATSSMNNLRVVMSERNLLAPAKIRVMS